MLRVSNSHLIWGHVVSVAFVDFSTLVQAIFCPLRIEIDNFILVFVATESGASETADHAEDIQLKR